MCSWRGRSLQAKSLQIAATCALALLCCQCHTCGVCCPGVHCSDVQGQVGMDHAGWHTSSLQEDGVDI